MHGSLKISSLWGKIQLGICLRREIFDIPTGAIGIDQDLIPSFDQDNLGEPII